MNKETTVEELIKLLSVFPGDKPVKIMGWYSIRETDDPEEIHSVCYLKELDWDSLEVIGECTDFVAIVTEEYDEIVSEFP
ncbi:MAG: hypothetical protein K6A34_07330 [Methanobrevibacter sp.]|nr:hypothetical protein [Methanobrevibacter sp.]